MTPGQAVAAALFFPLLVVGLVRACEPRGGDDAGRPEELSWAR